MQEILSEIHSSVLKGELQSVEGQVQAAVDNGISPEVILKEGLISAMTEVGLLFEEGDYFVPEMLIAARAMQGGLGILKPILVKADVKPAGKVIIGTVRGDLHDIGKNLVGMMLEGAGFDVQDLGTDVSPEEFVAAFKDSGADIIAMSALLTTTLPQMEETINALQKTGLRNRVKVIVGGAPVTDDHASQIGADGFAPDASQAARLVQTLMS